MNNKQLLAVTKMNNTATEIMRFISERQRNTVYTAFSGLRADMKKMFGHEVNREEFDIIFKHLESIGIGKLDVSERGVLLGFYWSVSIRKIGTLIKNRDDIGKLVLTVPEASNTKSNMTVVIINPNGETRTVSVSEDRIRELDL